MATTLNYGALAVNSKPAKIPGSFGSALPLPPSSSRELPVAGEIGVSERKLAEIGVSSIFRCAEIGNGNWCQFFFLAEKRTETNFLTPISPGKKELTPISLREKRTDTNFSDTNFSGRFPYCI